jgi:hypothetical protein
MVMARPLDHRGGGHVNLLSVHNSPAWDFLLLGRRRGAPTMLAISDTVADAGKMVQAKQHEHLGS